MKKRPGTETSPGKGPRARRKKPPAPAVNYAVLEAGTMVLTGFETGAAGKAGKLRIEVPAECDLTPGKFKWNAEAARFDPLQVFDAVPEDSPHTLHAIWAGFLSLSLAGHGFPPETETWLFDYGRSIDGDLGQNELWRDYLEARRARRENGT